MLSRHASDQRKIRLALTKCARMRHSPFVFAIEPTVFLTARYSRLHWTSPSVLVIDKLSLWLATVSKNGSNYIAAR